jgi:hypothetical protein
MKKLSILCGAFLLLGATANAQLIDEKDVTVTMDLQPVLQLDMSTPDQVEFVFDEISEYYAGITKYGATQLRVSATVSWDLYAVGRSTGLNGAGFWDQQFTYGNAALGGIDALPISLLELRQSQNNPVAAANDYFGAFPAVQSPGAGNSLYYDGSNTNTAPAAGLKYIAGDAATGAATSVVGGSYLTSTGTASNYFYVIDYRIVPGLPAVFPMAFTPAAVSVAEDLVAVNGAGSYAQPGVYTMYVQYILLEDQ